MVTTILPLTLEGATVRKKGKTIVGPVDLEIAGTGITLIIGPNGSGKTTLLRLIHGLERPREGKVQWQGDMTMVRRKQAFVFQTPILLRRSAIDNILYPLSLRGMARKQARTIAHEWLERTGLREMAETPAPYLSGGEKQKLALARALATNPQVLFLDEPTANLDGSATREIETLLHEAVDSNVRIVMTTHEIAQAKRLAREVVFLYRGKVHETGDAENFFTNPQTREAAAFLKGDILE